MKGWAYVCPRCGTTVKEARVKGGADFPEGDGVQRIDCLICGYVLTEGEHDREGTDRRDRKEIDGQDIETGEGTVSGYIGPIQVRDESD